MDKDNTSAISEWPPYLMMDEIWLRSRRALVHELEKYGYWMSAENYFAYRENQINLGNMIISEVFRDILGDEDYRYLNSEAIFRASNRQFRKDLPYIASFGYGISYITNLVTGVDDSSAVDILKIGSIFNTGISLFDHICDTYPETSVILTSIICKESLHEIAQNERKLSEFKSECEFVDNDDLRILMKFIAGFFDGLQTLKMHEKITNIDKVTLSILSAYKSEIESINPDGHSRRNLLTISKKKSVLPFEVIYNVSSLLSSGAREGSIRESTEFIKRIGEIFWLVDDLVDINQDIESTGLNSLILNIESSKYNLNNDRSIKYNSLKALLEGEYIGFTVDQIRSNLEYIMDFLEDCHYKDQERKSVMDLILFSIRDWLR